MGATLTFGTEGGGGGIIPRPEDGGGGGLSAKPAAVAVRFPLLVAGGGL